MSAGDSLAPIVRALGGDLLAGGRRAAVPAPGHSAADRSVSLLLDRGRVVVHGFGRASWREVLDDLRALGLVDRDGRLIGAVGGAPAPEPRPERVRREAALVLWAEGRPLAGRPAERHVRLRGVDRVLPCDLRSHPGAPASLYAGEGPRRPALLAGIRDPAGELCAVEVTFLGADGLRARMRTPRRTIGVLPPGCAVRLDPSGPRLLVAEGVFTALSASERFGWPCWALLSTSHLRRWSPPAGVEAVLIAADRGAEGERSARVLEDRLQASGLRVAVRWPPPPAGDWNEASVAGREEEGGRGRVSVGDGSAPSGADR